MQHLTPVLLKTQSRENKQYVKPVQFSSYPAVATVPSQDPHMVFDCADI